MKKKKKKKVMQVHLRLNILFFLIFLLFSALILRLGFVQIVSGSDFRREVERTEDVTVNKSVPRGRFLDSQYRVLVDNEPVDAITYTRLQSTKTEEMLEVAEKLASFITPSLDKVTERDKKDFWILKHKERAEGKITKQERKLNEENKLKNSELYKLQVSRVTEEELQELTDQDLNVLAIYREMASAKALTPQIIKNADVTDEEIALISENLNVLPGVDVTTDWERTYVYGSTLKTVIGSISSSDKGLPLEKLDYYLSRDYNLNDRVGTSYLELQYEDVLHGQKEKVKNVTDKAGNVLESIQISEGARGKDLVLTIDMDLQLAVEKIIEDELRAKKAVGGRSLLDRAFVVLMDPHTGEVLTMAGKQYSFDNEAGMMKMRDFATGAITTSYAMGSSVKGATVLMGYETGAISPGTVLYDRRLTFKGLGKLKGSYTNMGMINDLTALKRSSNVYMFLTAMKMGGYNYQPDRSLPLDVNFYDEMRYYYNQFGLGVRTGIDLPNESTGMKGFNNPNTGLVLDLSIGQYDMYTPIQLTQYIATIANGGKRVKPHLVKEIRDPANNSEGVGKVFREISPVVLNNVDMQTQLVERVQEGFRQVMQESGGTAAGTFRSAAYRPAGKTGTAESYYDGPIKSRSNELTTNLTLVAYAPYDNPEVAMSVVVPWAYDKGGSPHSMSQEIGKKVLDTYFNLKTNRAAQTNETVGLMEDEAPQ